MDTEDQQSMSIGHDAATESHTNSTRDQDQSDMQEDHDHSESHPQDSQPILDSQEGTGELVAAAETETLQAGEAWATQPTYYQLFQCRFDPPRPENNHLDSSSYGIVKSFSTRSTFNKTVGEIRLEQLGIQDDDVKMTNGRENDFFKAVKWSPDGTCLLSSSNDNCLRIFALPDATTTSVEDTTWTSDLLIKEGEVIYDMCWYPAMNSQDPASCCVLSSSRDHPVHLWDAYTGELRCSYTVVDHCEVNQAPTALCFNLDGSKIYCGYNNMIEIFDTSRPGRESLKRPTVKTRKSRQGQKGVISCLAFNPDHSGLYAAGSYLKNIGLYDARNDGLVMLLRDKSKKHQQGSGRTPEMGGVTQVQFSPDGQYLYSASRLDPFIRCWDIRDTANILYRLERPGALTNQRISFDISYDGKWLATGDMNGDISFFDLTSNLGEQPGPELDTTTTAATFVDSTKTDRLRARIRGHEDVVSATSFHPSGSILATSSGQRKYDLALESSDSDSDSDSNSDGDADADAGLTTDSNNAATTPSIIDNTIRLWALPGDSVWYVDGQRWEGTSMDVDGAAESAGNDSHDRPEAVTDGPTDSTDSLA